MPHITLDYVQSMTLLILLFLVLAYGIFTTFHIRKILIIKKTNRAIARTMVAIAYIDLPANKFEEISFRRQIRNLIGSKGSAQEALDKTISDNLVIETYYNRMKKFTNLKTISDRLKGKRMISEEYKGTTNGWSRSNFIPVEYDKNGNLKTVIYTVQWIHGEVLSLHGQLDIEETLLECVLTLSKNTDADTSINKLLANVASYHNADRAYIFEFNEKDGTTSNTYEWCNKNITSQIQSLQNLKMEDIRRFIDMCKSGIVNLADINCFDEGSTERRLLEQQGVNSIMCAPLFKEGKIIGFIGVDNPRLNQETETILISVASFAITELEKKSYIRELYDLSYKDVLTGVYNRHANVRDIDEISSTTANNIGIVYGDVNGLKEANDNFDHEHGDRLIISAANILKKYYDREDDRIYRVGGDEFIVISSNVQEDSFNENYSKMLDELGSDCILSTGKSWVSSCDNINEYVKTAESGMYASKRIYYQTHDRRSRV